jgi:hypothetical protein
MRIMTEKDRQLLQEHINMLVENFIEEEFLAEKGKKGKKDNKPHHSTKWEKKAGKQDKRKPKDKNDSKPKNKEEHRTKKNSKAATRRARVIQWLKDPSVNCAEIMRKLWKPSKKKEDAARSFFYKCRDGALNDSGVAYSFSDGDINRLYAIKNNLM